MCEFVVDLSRKRDLDPIRVPAARAVRVTRDLDLVFVVAEAVVPTVGLAASKMESEQGGNGANASQVQAV